jgi:hypothetical protein
MPIKSKAQRRKFAELLVKGEITPETYEEWNRGAGDAKLPERLHPKRKATPKRRKANAKRKPTAKSRHVPKSRQSSTGSHRGTDGRHRAARHR